MIIKGKPDLGCMPLGLFDIGDDVLSAGDGGDALGDHGPSGSRLVTHRPDLVRRRTDEREVSPVADLGELGVLRQESVAGMYGLRTGDFGCRNNPRDVQITLGGLGWTDAHRLVREPHVQGLAVRVRVHGDRFEAQLLTSTDDPQGDFTPIRD